MNKLLLIFLSLIFYLNISYSQSETVALGFGGVLAIPTNDFKNNVRTGYEIDAALLFAVARNIGVDLVVSKGIWKLKNDIPGKFESWSILTGLRYLAVWKSFMPYFSCRIGAQFNKLKLDDANSPLVPIAFSENFPKKTEFAFKLGTGFILRMSRILSLESELGYKLVSKGSGLGIKAGFLFNIY